jgi:hypothetical protein
VRGGSVGQCEEKKVHVNMCLILNGQWDRELLIR